MPKSAYEIDLQDNKIERYVVVAWVDNEAGVLARISGLFSGRGYNIESLAVAQVDEDRHISRITIATNGSKPKTTHTTCRRKTKVIYCYPRR